MSKKQFLFTGLALIIVLGIIFAAAFKIFLNMKPPQMPDMPPPRVTVAVPVEDSISRYDYFTGTTKAVQSVQVRARVSGYLKSIEFQDSSDVKKGDLLFVIEPDFYKANRDRAFANLKASQAELERAQLDLERVEKAAKTNSVSAQEVSTKKSERDKARAAVLANTAELANAELELSYTKVYAPIDGRVSRNLVDAGNLVGSGENTLLTTIVQLDPMYVYFNINERTLIRRLNNQSLNCNGNEPAALFISLADDEDYLHAGMLDYIDNTVDPKTGTIRVRGKIANRDKKILPGMFVRLRVPEGDPQKELLVNERALGTDFHGKYLLVTGPDNIVRQRPVVAGESINGMRVILDGLQKHEKYIVSGLQFARAGMPVTPVLQEPSEAVAMEKTNQK